MADSIIITSNVTDGAVITTNVTESTAVTANVVTGAKGDKGNQGDPTTVNGKTGASITLDAADVGADASGSATAALSSANNYTDSAVATLNSSLGTAAFTPASGYATAAQGAKADSAVQTETDPTVPAWAKTPSKPTYTKSEVGLANVDNTSDANKPVSTAQQTALDAKANASDTVNLTGDQTVAGVKTFSSSPIVPTATTNTQAVNKSQMDTADALKVNKSGDTMTGQLKMTGSATNGLIRVEQAANNLSSGIRVVNGGITLAGNIYFSDASTFAVISDGKLNLNGSGNRVGISGSEIISGTGFPEGSITAPVGSIYIDKAITNGASSWIKKSGTGNTGWKILEGDTGQRDITANLVNGWTATKIFVRRVNNEVYLQVEGLNAAAMTNTIFTTLSSGFRGYSNAYVSRMMLHTSAGPVAAWRVNIEATGGTYVGNSTTATPVLYGLAPFPTLDDWPSTLPGVSA